MDMQKSITATTPGQHPLATTLAEVHAHLSRARGADSADVNCMLLDAGVPVTITHRGHAVTFTPGA